MKTITLARKPIVGTVAKNVLEHGSGGLNINASRIAAEGETISNHSRGSDSAKSKGKYGDSKAQETHQTEGQKLGRFPANLILQHLGGCRCDGVKRVNANQSSAIGSGKGYEETSNNGVFNAGKGGVVRASTADADGKETVANWVCVQGCPVKALDEQSGVSGDTTEGVNRRGEGGQYATGIYGNAGPEGRTGETRRRIVDRGGAARFFKQVKP